MTGRPMTARREPRLAPHLLAVMPWFRDELALVLLVVVGAPVYGCRSCCCPGGAGLTVLVRS
jgi:hypothetical protein